MKKRIFSLLAILVLLAACFTFAKENTFVDESGTKIFVKKPFQRIISLYGAHTENLFSMGLDSEIVGVSENEAYPLAVMKKPTFSYHDDAEKFIATRPDLVLIRPMIAQGYADLVLKLQKAGIVVVSLQPNTIEETYSYWRDLGILSGREAESEKMIRKFQKEILRISSFVETVPNSERKRVYFEAIHSKTKTFSPSSITAFALKSAGGINVADDAVVAKGTNIADYGTERLLSKGDKIDVYLAQQGAMNHAKIGTIMEEGGFQAIRAVREGNIHIVDEKIVSRPTLRLLDGIYEIGRILYPGKFNDVSELKNRTILSRAKFAELFVKIMNIPLKTPDYQHDIQDRADGKHKYGNFRDVDYTGNDYKFIETAVYRGLFYNIDKGIFYPDKPITRKEIAFILFVYFDLIDAKPVSIQDIKDSDPLFNQIQKVAGLGILKLDKDGKFLPDAPVSGKEAISAITLAREHTVKGSRL